MAFAEIIKTAFSSLRTNKSRTMLTMLGVIIGVASVILLVAIGSGLKLYITQQLEGLGSNLLFVVPGETPMSSGKGGGGGMPGAGMAASKFTLNQAKDIERMSTTIKAIMPYTENNGILKFKGKAHTTQIAGVSYQYPQIRDHQLAYGSFFTRSQQNANKKVVVLGDTVANDLFGEQKAIGRKITLSGSRYTVVGVLKKKGAFGTIDMDDQAFIPVTTALQQYDMENVMSFWVEAKSPEDVAQTKREIKKVLLKTLDKEDFSVVDTKSVLATVSSILTILTTALGGIAAISLLVGGVGIMNIMLVSVTERTHEIGLRKAMGATPKMIMIQFLTEAIVLAVGGGVIGIGLGILGATIINHFFPTMVNILTIFMAFSVSATIGIVFGVAPAAKAAKLSPIDALRYE